MRSALAPFANFLNMQGISLLRASSFSISCSKKIIIFTVAGMLRMVVVMVTITMTMVMVTMMMTMVMMIMTMIMVMMIMMMMMQMVICGREQN